MFSLPLIQSFFSEEQYLDRDCINSTSVKAESTLVLLGRSVLGLRHTPVRLTNLTCDDGPFYVSVLAKVRGTGWYDSGEYGRENGMRSEHVEEVRDDVRGVSNHPCNSLGKKRLVTTTAHVHTKRAMPAHKD